MPIRMSGTGKYRTKKRITEKSAVCTEEGGAFPSFFVARHAIKQTGGLFWAHWYPPGYQYLYVRERKGVHLVDLFADVPEEMIENTLQTIRRNLDRVGLYGGHTLGKHTDIQLLTSKI